MNEAELFEARKFEPCYEYEHCRAQEFIENLLEHADAQANTIETLKATLISERQELILYSSDYIVWRYHHDIDKIESQEDWKPLEAEAKLQLVRDMPEIDWEDAK